MADAISLIRTDNGGWIATEANIGRALPLGGANAFSSASDLLAWLTKEIGAQVCETTQRPHALALPSSVFQIDARLRRFLDVSVVRDASSHIASSAIWARFNEWSAHQGARQSSRHAVGRGMAEMGFPRCKIRGHTYWRGIRWA